MIGTRYFTVALFKKADEKTDEETLETPHVKVKIPWLELTIVFVKVYKFVPPNNVS